MKTKLLQISLLLTGIAAVIVYLVTPDATRSVRLFPDPEMLSSIESFAGGSNSDPSWHSSVEQKDSVLEWYFRKGNDPKGYGGIKWESARANSPANLSFYDTLLLRFSSAPRPMTLLLTIRTLDPSVSEPEKRSTWKANTKEFSVLQGQQMIQIPLEELYVPQWWFDNNSADPQKNDKFLNRTMSLEISPDYSEKSGSEALIQIRSLTLRGYSNRNFAMLMIALLVLIILSVGLRTKKNLKVKGK